MFKALEGKTLEVFVNVINYLKAARDERGQTSGEYVAVTAVGVIIAISILYTILSEQINTAVTEIGNTLVEFVENNPS